MKSLLLASAIVLGAGVGLAYAEAKQDFALVNKTGYEISELYVSPSKANNWEEDVLSDDTLDDSEGINVHFHNSGKTCSYDIKVVYADDDSTAVWEDIDLCEVSRVTLRYNRKTDTTTATFD